MTARQPLSRTKRLRLFERDHGVCHLCEQRIQAGQKWEAEHRIPLALGGADDESNMAPAHVKCHTKKTKADKGQIAKATRQRFGHLGIRSTTARPMPGSKASGLKKRFDGTVEVRR